MIPGRMDHYYHADTENQRGGYMPKKRPSEYLKERRIFFTCDAEEFLLPQVIELLGEDQMMVSVDIPHGEVREESMDVISKANYATRLPISCRPATSLAPSEISVGPQLLACRWHTAGKNKDTWIEF